MIAFLLIVTMVGDLKPIYPMVLWRQEECEELGKSITTAPAIGHGRTDLSFQCVKVFVQKQ